MSLREAYSLAHTAKCKLYLAADRPDRDLRFLVGHAMHLDSLMLRIVEIEENVEKPKHSSAVQFKGAGSSGSHQVTKKSPLARKSPSPARADDVDTESSEEEQLLDEDESGEVPEELGLTRFASGAAQPPRYLEPEPPLIPSDDDSSDDEEEYEAAIRDIINKNSGGDKELLGLYHDVQNCTCHKSDAPEFERMWELPGGKDGVRAVVAEIKA